MKNLIFSFIAIIFFIALSCTNRTIYSKNEKDYGKKAVTDTLWQLKNRIPNCDSAFVFMEQVIVPVKSIPFIENEVIIERIVTIKIPGEGFNSNDPEKYKFYINSECLIGRTSAEIIKLFCTPETNDAFKTIDQLFQERKKYWILSVTGFGNNLNIKISEGKVVLASYSKSVSSH